jgi:apolipoprotein N-acyltransferase
VCVRRCNLTARRAILAAVATQRHVTVVAGFNQVGLPEARNTAVVFDSNGRVVFYSRTGDWFPWLCVIAVINCVAIGRKWSLVLGP